MILPMCVEDYVSPTNTVRAIDAYASTLDLATLGYQHGQIAATTGLPAFNPAVLLKLYLYGYLQPIHSSRRLEQEAVRNLERVWLVEDSKPTYKTIADFRKNNGAALKATHRDFLLLCKELALFGGEEVGVDGSFFKADTNKAHIYTAEKLDRQLAQLEKKIQSYQDTLEKNDAAGDVAGRGSLGEDNQLADKHNACKKNRPKNKGCSKSSKTAATNRFLSWMKMRGY